MIIVKPDKKGLALAIRHLKAGKSVVYPTDTSYGLAVDATNSSAVRRLYQIKQRKHNQPIHVVAASLTQAKRIAKFDARAERIFRKFLPGPLTLVLKIESGIRNQESWKILSGGTSTIGIRMPKNKIALKLVKKLGRPVTATSANPPNHLGGRDSYSIGDVTRQFNPKKHRPDLILDAGKLKRTKPSTIVDLTGRRVRIIRQGPISASQILKATNNS